jgi:hypothetical protein
VSTDVRQRQNGNWISVPNLPAARIEHQLE